METNKKTKLFLFFIILLALASVVSAQPPFQEGSSFTEGYSIEYPTIDVIEINQSIEFHFHVFNISNGQPITNQNGVVCYFHLYNQTNRHLVKSSKTTIENNFDYSFSVEGTNFSTDGLYSYVVQCNNSNYGGFTSVGLYVTYNGREIIEGWSILVFAMLVGSVLALLGCAFLFAYLYSNSDNLNKLLRLLYLGASLLCGVATVAVVQSIILDQGSVLEPLLAGPFGGVYSMVIWLFRIVMILWVLYLIYSSAMALLGKKDEAYLRE